MNINVVFVLSMLAVSTHSGIGAQTTIDTINRALAAAPASARDGAAVIRWNAQGAYETIKAGTNRWVCWDVSGQFGFPPFAVMCTSVGSLESFAQFVRFVVEGKSAQGAEALRAAARADGSRVRPEYGSLQRMLAGSDQASAQAVTLIWVPGATMESIGLPATTGNERARLSLAGTVDAHIVVSGL
jgi:hypothetical protein